MYELVALLSVIVIESPRFAVVLFNTGVVARGMFGRVIAKDPLGF